MPLKLKESVTLFLSVRRGLETCLLNEIKRNPSLNCIQRIHINRSGKSKESVVHAPEEDGTQIEQPVDIDVSRVTRHGNDKWLYMTYPETSPVISKSITPANVETKHVQKCVIRLQAGGLEVKCNREWLIGCVLRLRSVESVWIRVGYPFRCHDKDTLIQRISALPWSQYLPRVSPEDIPLRIISRHSSVWSSVVIGECVREGIRAHFSEAKSGIARERVEGDRFCISITLNRNTCYVAVQCSSRLSPRPFNLVNNTSLVDKLHCRSTFLPYWSLTKTRLNARLEGGLIANSTEGENRRIEDRSATLQLDSVGNCQTNGLEKIPNIKYLLEDKDSVTDVMIAGLLHAGSIFRTIWNRPLKIWNPFCGSGIVITEILALALQLPNYTFEHTPSVLFREIAYGGRNELYRRVLENNLRPAFGSLRDLEIVGSEDNPLKLSQAACKLDKFSLFYRSSFPSVREQPKKPSCPHPSLFGHYCNGLPVDVTLHQSSAETIAPLMYGSMVIATLPCMKNEAGKEQLYDTIKAYRSFGSVIGSRSDWKGVFVITKGRAFEHFSGLQWKCITKVTNSRGSVTTLLGWTGRLQPLTKPEEKVEHLNDLEFM